MLFCNNKTSRYQPINSSNLTIQTITHITHLKKQQSTHFNLPPNNNINHLLFSIYKQQLLDKQVWVFHKHNLKLNPKRFFWLQTKLIIIVLLSKQLVQVAKQLCIRRIRPIINRLVNCFVLWEPPLGYRPILSRVNQPITIIMFRQVFLYRSKEIIISNR